MLFYAQKLPKKDLFAHASQYCTGTGTVSVSILQLAQRPSCCLVSRGRALLCVYI
jgi:hypothetical protein